MCGDRQEPSQARSSVNRVRNHVRALDAVISCDASRFASCEKCARAMASMQWRSVQAWTADLMLLNHVVLLRTPEAAAGTAPSWARSTRARCGLVAHAEQSWCWLLLCATDCKFVTSMYRSTSMATKGEEVVRLSPEFQLALCRHVGLPHTCTAELVHDLRSLQVVPTKRYTSTVP